MKTQLNSLQSRGSLGTGILRQLCFCSGSGVGEAPVHTVPAPGLLGRMPHCWVSMVTLSRMMVWFQVLECSPSSALVREQSLPHCAQGLRISSPTPQKAWRPLWKGRGPVVSCTQGGQALWSRQREHVCGGLGLELGLVYSHLWTPSPRRNTQRTCANTQLPQQPEPSSPYGSLNIACQRTRVWAG